MAQNDDAKRATTVITIAQLKFRQSLKKEEPETRLPPVSVEACSQLFSAIDAVLAQNTPMNIQKCTEWIVKHIAPSRIRIAVLGDYLVSVSKSVVVETMPAAAKKAVRNRLDLLLVVNDALHTDKYHRNSTAKHGLLGTEFTSHLAELVELAASCAVEKDSQVEKKLRAIINYWAVNKLVSQDLLKSLRERADEIFLQAQGGTPIRKRNYLLPEYHGDQTAPWYELPASYMLDQMVKQPNRPLDPYRIKVARFDKKPVSTHVRKLLDNYFENIDLKHTPTGDNPTGETKKYNLWLDPMGQLVKRNKETGETRTVSNGYGWSTKFCQDMQKDGVPESIKTLRDDAERMEAAPERQRDRRRYSRSPRRRRRSSSVSSHGRGRDRRSRSGSYASRSSYDSRSRSRSRHHDRRRRSQRDEERGRNDRDRRFDDRDNDSRRPPPRPLDRGQPQSSGQWNGQQAPNRNTQGSPGNNQFPQNAHQNFTPNFSQAPQPPFNAPPFPPQPPMPNQFPGQFSMQPFPPPPPPMPFQAPGGFPGGIPPPPPPNFSGPFPPPLPNIAVMPNNPYNFNNQWNSFQQANNPGFNQQQNQNQGYNQNQNQGQGGFQGGRGGYGGNQGGGNYNNRGGYGGRGQRGGSFPELQHSNNTKHSTPRKLLTDHGLDHQFREYSLRACRVMAPPKRKRKPTRTTSNKRSKYTQPDTDYSDSSSCEEEGTANGSQEEWEALRILKQTGQGFGLKYLVEWKGVDPTTGKQWEPTWERASNASERLRASWKREQARQAQEKERAAATAKSSTQQRSAPEASPAQATQTRARNRRIIQSPETLASASAIKSPAETSQSVVAAPSSATIDIGAPIPAWTSPQVNIDVRGDSFNCSEYGLHAEIPESQPSPAKSITEDTDLDSSQLFTSQRAFRASGIVPDTQSSAGSLSYIPVTQEELESSLHSDSSDESTEEHIVGYSVSEFYAWSFGCSLIDVKGLLDTDAAPTLSARAQSPATSIAETVADTTQDLHSQRQLESQQEQPEIPDTLESPVTSDKTDQTGTQDDSASSRHTEPAVTDSHSSEDQHEAQSLEEVAFVESTTQFEHETSARDLQPPTQEPGEHSVATEEQPESVEHNAQPITSVAESELLAIADTPQISQLTSTAREGVTDEEQLSPAHRLETAISLTERSVLEENAQFPFHSQYPAFFDPRSATKFTQQALIEPPRTCSTHEVLGARLSEDSPGAHQESGAFNDSEERSTIDEISQPLGHEQSHTSPQRHSVSQLSHTQTNDGNLEDAASRDIEEIVDQVDVIVVSQPPSTEQSAGSREHNAQFVPSSAYLSTQEDVTESIRATVEIDPGEAPRSKHSSPCSRHDSSQETPERQLQSVEHSSSPISHPPSYSLRTLDSNVPLRPATPTLRSSLSKMAESTTESTAARAARRLEELQAANRAANPYTPRKRIRASQPSSVASTAPVASASPLQSNRVPAPPTINISAEGTRSPSTVPDRSPAPPARTSLRTVAFANAKDKATESWLENPLAATSTNTDAGPTQEKAELAAAVATTPSRPIESPRVSPDDNIDEMNDVDQNNDYDDDESIYNDDLQLENDEYIVPLFIEGRQRDTYIEYIKRKTDLLNAVLGAAAKAMDPAPEKTDEAEQVITYLRAVETHPDLTYAEAESTTGFEMRSATDVQHGAQFGIDNSVKFKFLRELFNNLRDKDMHIILLLDQDSNALFNILRTFFAAAAHNYNMPTKGYQSNASNDALTITIFPNTASPIIRPADLIICLDGVQSAAQIRRSNWAMASRRTIPVLHLVISQTIGHIERYILPNLERRLHIETILAGLGQIEQRSEIGNPVDIDTPSAAEAAKLIASWLVLEDDQESTEWPLPSIGSARSFLDYDATQQSVRSATSSPAPERTKRPLEADDSDTAKRVRYTPQLRVTPDSSAIHEHEVTRVSDSMPGSAATETARLAACLDRANSELLRAQKEHREEQIMWNRQQTEHENRQQEYRKLFNEKAEVDRVLESMARNHDKLRTQVEVQATEQRTLREELEAQRNLSLASTNEKDVEITRLRKELEAANIERNKVLKSAKSTEQTLEYTKEQYRDASNTAGQLQTDLTSLKTQNAKLAHQASGEVAKLKQLHLDRSHKTLMQQNTVLKNENTLLKMTLKAKEEELVRAKNNSGRAAYGTRGQSTTPQPKTRSRAASPERGSRAPRGGGRISNLVAEER
ncbi:hypothetical protein BU25DRAFT_449154 [Macroventuria anomochaeta]|uniref:Uncharacterized protein n=1 Tax=Macroventuria anomochaeta TaxID=301207 RepID=A0ACB6RXY3_9PLEO|nr:uncharacterized protein BU25DRAFT_449154 [Macroventuria anomochaeta]KAF2626567.1 hypothetical protein BU25DRAFT_449154 [Macroventuria anomochaeta]